MKYTVASIYHVNDLPGLAGANIFLRPVGGNDGVLVIASDPQLLKLVAGDTVTITVEATPS